MASKLPILIPVEDGLQYVMSSDNETPTVLQLVIHPQRLLIVDRLAVCWATDNLTDVDLHRGQRTVNKDRSGFSRAIIRNDRSSPVSIGLAQENGAKVLAVMVASVVVGLLCYKDCYLCSTSQLHVEDRSSPVARRMRFSFVAHTDMYRFSSIQNGEQGTVFLQSTSDIMQKELGRNDVLIIKSDCLVAFQESCSIALDPSQNGLQLVKVQGPGAVYYSAQSHRRSTNFSHTRRHSQQTLATYAFSCLILALVLFLVFSVDVQLVTNWQEPQEN